MKDFRGRKIILHSPSPYRSSLPFTFDRPLIIVPMINIGESSEPYRFRLLENSEYAEMWKDYPKIKPRVSVKSGDSENPISD